HMKATKLKIMAIFLTLSINTGFSQNQKSIEGFYNLSKFEMFAKLYLLDNNTFYYMAAFGSVDLEVYGNYIIQDNNLFFQAIDEQTQPFILYARTDKALKDSLAFTYENPNESNREFIVFAADNPWFRNPTAKSYHVDKEYFKIGKQQIDTLKVGYPAHRDKAGNFIKVSSKYTAKIPKGNNDFFFLYNHHYKMRKQVEGIDIQIKENALVIEDRTVKRQDLKKINKEKMMAFFKSQKMFSDTIENKGKTYQRIAMNTSYEQPVLKINKDGILEVVKIYTKDGEENIYGIYHYVDGQLKIIPTMENEFLLGQRKWYFENGQIEEIGKFKNYQQEGEWKTFFENGQLQKVIHYKKGNADGLSKRYFENGQLEEEGKFSKGQKVGKWTFYYKNGNTKKTVFFKDGKWKGEVKTYFPTGQLESVSYHKDTKITSTKYNLTTGKVQQIGAFNAMGEKTGEWKTFYDNGQLKETGNYSNGQKTGEWKYYDEEGKLIQ
ncbi:MAG TPA: hypothetical protein DEO36_10560, partial [Flavobacteriaceae bacterium]|nr:hypothetical protein [Flavobacteriaceae bacterium]